MAIFRAKLTKDVDIYMQLCVARSTFFALTILTGVDNFQIWFSQNIFGTYTSLSVIWKDEFRWPNWIIKNS